MSSPSLADEVRALWSEMLGEPAPAGDDPQTLLARIIEAASLPDYQGFANGALNRVGVVLPAPPQ